MSSRFSYNNNNKTDNNKYDVSSGSHNQYNVRGITCKKSWESIFSIAHLEQQQELIEKLKERKFIKSSPSHDVKSLSPQKSHVHHQSLHHP